MATRLCSVYDLSLSNPAGKHWIRIIRWFADLAGFKNPEILINGPRRDIFVKNENKLTVTEHAAMKRILRKHVITK